MNTDRDGNGTESETKLQPQNLPPRPHSPFLRMVWNTGRHYTKDGQRMAAAWVGGGVVMVDIDRNLDYWLPICPLNVREIMARYDANDRKEYRPPEEVLSLDDWIALRADLERIAAVPAAAWKAVQTLQPEPEVAAAPVERASIAEQIEDVQTALELLLQRVRSGAGRQDEIDEALTDLADARQELLGFDHSEPAGGGQ